MWKKDYFLTMIFKKWQQGIPVRKIDFGTRKD